MAETTLQVLREKTAVSFQKKTPKEYTFLVHTKTSRPKRTVGGTQKALINAHIARQGHQRRREENEALFVAQAAGATLGSSSLPAGITLAHSHIYEAENVQDDETCYIPEPPSFEWALFVPTTTSVLHRGNSDPFMSTTIPVTAAVHECLVFTRDCFLPSLHGKEIELARTTVYMDAFWQDAVDSLQNKCTGYAYLARSTAIIQSINFSPDIERLNLFFKTQAISALRKEMARTRSNRDRLTVCWAIFSLFSAEIAAHNFPAARVHGRFLRQILQPDDGRMIETDSRLQQAVMYQDIQRASVSLTRSSFDLSRWLTEFLPASWLEETNLNVTLPHMTVDNSVSDEILRNILIESKEWLTILGLLLAQPLLLNPLNISNGSTRLLILEGKLIDLYLAMLDAIQSTSYMERTLQLYHTAAGALAALTWLRRMGNHENMGIGSRLSLTGSNVYNAGPIIIEKMEILLRASEGDAQMSSSDAWRMRLWCFYVGAVVEQSLPWTNPFRAYHNRGFMGLATQKGLVTWDDIQSVLEGFLYFEGVGPTARTWYERMSKNSDVASLVNDTSAKLANLRLGYIQSFTTHVD
jgi:hypothetical protein